MLTNTTSSNKQQGAALIAVLIIVIVVTMLGVAAMRMGLTGLTLATNSQAANLLFQSADLGMTTFQRAINNGVTTTDITNAMDVNGVIGKSGENAYCLSTQVGATWGTGAFQVSGLSEGACVAGTTSQYISGRNLALTQVNYIRRPQASFGTNSGASNLAASMGSAGQPVQQDLVIVSSTAVMPTLGSADLETINDCLSGTGPYYTVDDGTNFISDDEDNPNRQTITDCLTDVGAVFTTHQDQFLIGFTSN